MKDDEDIQGFLEDLGLTSIPGYAIKDEEMVEGIEEAGLGFGLDVFAPEPDSDLIGDEATLA